MMVNKNVILPGKESEVIIKSIFHLDILIHLRDLYDGGIISLI